MPTLRVATEADFPGMMRVRASVRENRLSDPGRIGLADYADILARGGRAWVAEERARIVAFAAADLPRRNVWALFVDPAFEGRGIGRALHDVMMAWLFEQGPEPVWLTTDPATRAASFYRAAGWTEAGPADRGEIRFEMTPRAWRRSR